MVKMHPLKQFYDVIDNGTPQEKWARLPDFPRMIELEITNHCNFHCVFCPTGSDTAGRPRGFMSNALYEKLVDEIAGNHCGLKFVGVGEPTIHKNFIKFVRMAKERGIICHLTTNGSMMTDNFIEELIASGLDSVKFSFQGVTAAGYKIMRRSSDFEELLKRIERLYKIRGGGIPYLTIGTSVTMETPEEIEAFKARCGSICDKLEIGTTYLLKTDLSKIEDVATRSLLEKFQQEQSKVFRRYVCCPMVYDVLVVHWDGTVCSCCQDAFEPGQMTLGNLNEETLSTIWKSEKQEAYRKILSQGRYEDITLCKECYDFMGWTYGDNS